MDFRSQPRLSEVLLSHYSGMLPPSKLPEPFIDVVQVSAEVKLESRKWNVSDCTCNSAEDYLQLGFLCQYRWFAVKQISQASLLFQGFTAVMDHPASVKCWFSFPLKSDGERDGWRNIFPSQSLTHLWNCRITVRVHITARWLTALMTRPRSDWSASLGGHASGQLELVSLAATGGPCLSFYQWPPSETKQWFSVACVGKYLRWLFSVKTSVSKWPSVACLLLNFDLVLP